jgi:outer membrane protein assembly factor BamD (BamD/ComL family)
MKKRAFLFLATAAVLLAVACNTANLERTSPKTAEDYYARGLEYLENGDYDRAIADYEVALQLLEPEDDLFAETIKRNLEETKQARGR